MDQPLPLIPRKLMFGNPERTSGTISPDGRQLGFLAPLDGVLNVWVAPADDPQAARAVTHDTKRGIRHYYWAYTNRHVLYLQDKDGDENWRVYSVALDTNEVKDLTPIEGVQARLESLSHLHPTEVLIGLNDRNPQLHDLYRVNLETGERTLVLENRTFVGFLIDDHHVPRLGVAFEPSGGGMLVRLLEDGSSELFLTIAPEDIITTEPVGFDKDVEHLYIITSAGRNTAALCRINLATKAETLLAEDARADIVGVMAHPTEKTLQAYSTNYQRREWHPLDPAVAGDLEALREVTDGDPEVVSRTLDDSVWIVTYEMDDGPVRFYRYDRGTRQAQFLFTVRPALDGAPLVKMHPVVIKSRDGLDLVSYLTLPEPKSGTCTNFGRQKLVHVPDFVETGACPQFPLVLWVHGGPWYRDFWGYNSVHQWLANRGYAVLSVNFRGSTGFGKAFVNAADREWGGKMHDDLIDAVNWAIDEGIADPERLAIAGGSYGGYAALVGITMTPEVFACGVDLVGIPNLITMLENVPEYWVPLLPLWKNRVGDDTTEEGRALLRERSPLSYVDRICRPLLIGQGANDPRVRRQESDQIVQAMQDRGIPVTYLLYPDEGHGFARPENSLSFWAVMEGFLARHLGGRCEPVGDDFQGSSIQILAEG